MGKEQILLFSKELAARIWKIDMFLLDEAVVRVSDITISLSYAVCYGEFMYQAGSWKYPRRVVCKVEKPTGQLIHMYTFIVTNMDSAAEELIRFYCKNAKAADRYHSFETAEGCRKGCLFSKIYHIQALQRLSL